MRSPCLGPRISICLPIARPYCTGHPEVFRAIVSERQEQQEEQQEQQEQEQQEQQEQQQQQEEQHEEVQQEQRRTGTRTSAGFGPGQWDYRVFEP